MKAVYDFFSSRYFLYAFAAFAVIVYLSGLSVALLGPDEPRYAQVAREMFERGDWVTPTLGSHNWFEKPALLYWLQIASYNIFGVGELAARFGSALFGLGTIMCLWIFGNTAESDPNERSYISGKLLAVVAASTLGLLVFSRGASFDIILTFPITASLTAFFVFDRMPKENGNRYWALVLFYFFIGLAVLAKGLVGIVFPFAIVTFYHVLSFKLPQKVLVFSLIWGTLLAAAVASLWYVPMYGRHGYNFIDEFFIQHHFQRYTSNKYQHPQPFHFFFWVLPLMTIPWIPFFFTQIWHSIKVTIARYKKTSEEKLPSAVVFAFAWMLVPLVFFSLSGSKLPGYILPAVPAALILAAESIGRFVFKKNERHVWVKALATATLVIVFVIIHVALPKFAEVDSVKGLIAAADARGYSQSNVAGFLTISHNAEFYAAKRLLRNYDGRQKRLGNLGELDDQVRVENRPLLILLKKEHIKHLSEDAAISYDVLADNGELAIAAVTRR